MDFRFSVPSIKYIIMKNQLNGMLEDQLNPKDIVGLTLQKMYLILYFNNYYVNVFLPLNSMTKLEYYATISYVILYEIHYFQ